MNIARRTAGSVPSITRRAFVQHTCIAACACRSGGVLGAAGIAPGGDPLRSPARSDVQLLDGPLLAQFRAQQALFLGLDDDALLKPFRQRAGLAAPGADMGGWYDDSRDFHIDPKDWGAANWHGFIPGHSFGQYVSGLARGYAMTRDAATRHKVSDLVGKYAATISPKFFADYNLPAYTFDKLAIGLIDAQRFADVPVKDAFARLTDSVLPSLPERALTREERRARPYDREAQIWDEPYTLPENLLLATESGLGSRYRAIATRYVQGALFDPLAEGRSPLKGKHAYSHVNALSSAMAVYRDTRDEKYLRAARNGFDFVAAQSYATGGWGPNEELLAADDTETLNDMLGSTHRSFETPCGAYAHFKITRSLLALTRDSRYGDSMERVLYNTILGALPTRPDGDTFYYSDYNDAGARKFYREEKWPCCSGTFVQLTADYGVSAYLSDERGWYVNLYVPSRVSADLGGARVTLTQVTNYPAGDSSGLTLETSRPAAFALRLRIPAWAGAGTRVRVNGRDHDGPFRAGAFHALERTWKSGDVVDITFGMAPRLEALNAAHPEKVALLTGPRALFPIAAPDVPLAREQLLGARREADGAWALPGKDGVRLKPFADITNETYRLYSRLR